MPLPATLVGGGVLISEEVKEVLTEIKFHKKRNTPNVPTSVADIIRMLLNIWEADCLAKGRELFYQDPFRVRWWIMMQPVEVEAALRKRMEASRIQVWSSLSRDDSALRLCCTVDEELYVVHIQFICHSAAPFPEVPKHLGVAAKVLNVYLLRSGDEPVQIGMSKQACELLGEIGINLSPTFRVIPVAFPRLPLTFQEQKEQLTSLLSTDGDILSRMLRLLTSQCDRENGRGNLISTPIRNGARYPGNNALDGKECLAGRQEGGLHRDDVLRIIQSIHPNCKNEEDSQLIMRWLVENDYMVPLKKTARSPVYYYAFTAKAYQLSGK